MKSWLCANILYRERCILGGLHRLLPESHEEGIEQGLEVCHPGLSFICSTFWKVIVIVKAVIKRLQKQPLKDALVNLV